MGLNCMDKPFIILINWKKNWDFKSEYFRWTGLSLTEHCGILTFNWMLATHKNENAWKIIERILL